MRGPKFLLVTVLTEARQSSKDTFPWTSGMDRISPLSTEAVNGPNSSGRSVRQLNTAQQVKPSFHGAGKPYV